MARKRKNEEIEALLPEQYRRPVLHRISIQDDVFQNLKRIRRRERLWDSSDAIKFVLKKCAEWEELNVLENKKK